MIYLPHKSYSSPSGLQHLPRQVKLVSEFVRPDLELSYSTIDFGHVPVGQVKRITMKFHGWLDQRLDQRLDHGMRRMLGEWASLPFLAGFLSKLDPCGYGGPKTRRSHINFHCEVAAGHLSPKASKREAGGGESEAQRITLERCWIDYEMGWKTPLPFWKPKFRAVFRGLSAQVLNIPQLCFTPLPSFFPQPIQPICRFSQQ